MAQHQNKPQTAKATKKGNSSKNYTRSSAANKVLGLFSILSTKEKNSIRKEIFQLLDVEIDSVNYYKSTRSHSTQGGTRSRSAAGPTKDVSSVKIKSGKERSDAKSAYLKSNVQWIQKFLQLSSVDKTRGEGMKQSKRLVSISNALVTLRNVGIDLVNDPSGNVDNAQIFLTMARDQGLKSSEFTKIGLINAGVGAKELLGNFEDIDAYRKFLLEKKKAREARLSNKVDSPVAKDADTSKGSVGAS